MTVMLLATAATGMAQQSPSADASVLSNKSRSELLDSLSDVERCGEPCRWDIADILGKPKNKAFLLSEFQRRKDEDQQLGIIYSLYRVNDPDIATFFKRLVGDGYDDGEDLYYPLNYLAKRCDPDALWVLSGNGKGGYTGYPGCLQWGKTVELFGKCKYRPAIPYLIASVQAACMNIGIAAVEELQMMYPGTPDLKDYSLAEIEKYFRRRAASEFPETR
jgi:hypothetical protein